MKISWEAVEEEMIIKSLGVCGMSCVIDVMHFLKRDNSSIDESNTNNDIDEMSDNVES